MAFRSLCEWWVIAERTLNLRIAAFFAVWCIGTLVLGRGVVGV